MQEHFLTARQSALDVTIDLTPWHSKGNRPDGARLATATKKKNTIGVGEEDWPGLDWPLLRMLRPPKSLEVKCALPIIFYCGLLTTCVPVDQSQNRKGTFVTGRSGLLDADFRLDMHDIRTDGPNKPDLKQ